MSAINLTPEIARRLNGLGINITVPEEPEEPKGVELAEILEKLTSILAAHDSRMSEIKNLFDDVADILNRVSTPVVQPVVSPKSWTCVIGRNVKGDMSTVDIQER